MDFKRYGNALKFGLAPREQLEPFFKMEGAGGLEPNHNSDSVLADLLGEHDDPRELIVRRDLEYRSRAKENRTTVADEFEKHADSLHQHRNGDYDHPHRLPDGTELSVYRDSPSKGEGNISGLTWRPYPDDLNSVAHYVAAVTHEEGQHVLDKLGLA